MNLLVWSSWVAHPAGGQEITALEMALEFKRRGHFVVLVGAYDNAPDLRARIPDDLPYYFFDLHRRRIKPHLSALRLLQGVIERHGIQVVSAHGSIYAPYEACRRRGIPLVWTVHGAQPRKAGFWEQLKFAGIRRAVRNQRTHVVAVSRATAEIIKKDLPCLESTRLHVIGVGRQNETALTALPLPQRSSPWHLGFVGRLVERKRPLDLVAIARRLEGKIEFDFHVFGDGPLLEPLRDCIREQRLEHRFILHGYWDKGSAGMIEQIHLLVHPDREEPFGAALLEAQLGGRPVVAYNVGGNPEIVEHGITGWLVPVGDTDALAAGVCSMVGERFQVCSAAARLRAMKKFSMAKMIDNYLALFQTACVSA